MTALGVDIDLREDYLEDHWADECRCEAKHGSRNPICSVEVTARFRSCTENKLVCATTEAYVQACIDRARASLRNMCEHCGHLTHTCWSVTPV